MRRGKFNLGSFKNLTCDMGYLIPIQVQDVIAGDSFRGASQVFMRMTPMLAPIMHPIYISVRHFFVPYRIIWDDFEEFITKNNENLQVPKVKLLKNEVGSLFDYLGIPPFEAKENHHMLFNALPLRAYQLIWNRYFRDQDLQSEIEIDLSSTLDDQTPANLQKVCWHKDYFTISRPWEQKGEEVSIPIISSSNPKKVSTCITFSVSMKDNPHAWKFYENYSDYNCDNTLYSSEWWYLNYYAKLYEKEPGFVISDNLSSIMTMRAPGGLGCKTINVTATVISRTTEPYQASHETPNAFITINEYSLVIKMYYPVQELGMVSVSTIRSAIAEQRLRERKAKFGSQYRDLLASMGVNYEDSRLQEPEFITGSNSVFRTSEIIQTAGAGSDPVGSLRGYGIGYNRTNGFKRYFHEHGIFMTCMCVRPLNMYSDGVPRMFLKENANDFMQHEIAQLVPMQEVHNSELYVEAGWRNTQGNLLNGNYFGYIDRYEEFRYTQSSVSGEFRTFYKDWHLARMFEETPVLNSDFLTCNPSKRIFAEQTQHSLIIMAQNMLRARRILPQFAKTGAL